MSSAPKSEMVHLESEKGGESVPYRRAFRMYGLHLLCCRWCDWLRSVGSELALHVSYAGADLSHLVSYVGRFVVFISTACLCEAFVS
jgi:hypothetical protein